MSRTIRRNDDEYIDSRGRKWKSEEHFLQAKRRLQGHHENSIEMKIQQGDPELLKVLGMDKKTAQRKFNQWKSNVRYEQNLTEEWARGGFSVAQFDKRSYTHPDELFDKPEGGETG